MKGRKENRFLLLSGLRDLERLWAFKPMRMGLIGILLVPLVYCVIYLSAFYDPYENLPSLPVALVNEDRGAVPGRRENPMSAMNWLRSCRRIPK